MDFSSLNLSETYSNNRDSIINYAIILIIIAYVTVKLYYVSTDPTLLLKNNNETTILLVTGLFVIFWLILYKSSSINMNNPTLNAINGIVFAIIVFCFLYFYNNFSSSSVSTATYIFNIILFASAIIFLAMFFFVFSNYLKILSGWTGFFTYLVFYIPCLLIDFVNYIIKEYKLTTTPIFVLFIAEIILILLYIYLPALLNYIDNSDAVVLLDKPEFINNMQTIDDVNTLISYKDPLYQSTLFTDEDNPNGPETLYRYNYAISMWIYLNSYPPNNTAYNLEKNIFNMANGCPKITYRYDTIYNVTDQYNIKDKLLVYFTNNIDPSTGIATDISGVPIKIDKQKWNQLVFNYNSTSADLFVNGNLEYSYKFSDNATSPPKLQDNDIIQYGDTDGLYGSICNVKYHKNPLSNMYIVNSYNILQKRNPPTNFL